MTQRQGDIHLEAVTRHDGPGLPGHGAPVDEAETAGLVADEEVVHHRHVRQQVDLLIDGADPQALGVGCVRRGDGDAIEFDAPPVGLVDAGEGLDQGGLAGAVLAEQRHDLSPAQGEVHLMQGTHPGKDLADTAGVQQHILSIF
ncbi:hypothetical protein D3C79_801550 [compost metagenome]